MFNACWAVPAPFPAVTVRPVLPEAVGTPAITPVEASSVTPAGRLPLTPNVVGAFDAAMRYEKRWPRTACAAEPLVITGRTGARDAYVATSTADWLRWTCTVVLGGAE